MVNLRKFTLDYDGQKDDWALREEGSGQTRKRYESKEEATKGGVLKSALGKEGGSVKIRKKTGAYQEERTYPRKRDPKKSPG